MEHFHDGFHHLRRGLKIAWTRGTWRAELELENWFEIHRRFDSITINYKINSISLIALSHLRRRHLHRHHRHRRRRRLRRHHHHEPLLNDLKTKRSRTSLWTEFEKEGCADSFKRLFTTIFTHSIGGLYHFTEWVDEWMIDWMSGWLNDWVRMDKRMSAWLNEWVNGWFGHL